MRSVRNTNPNSRVNSRSNSKIRTQSPGIKVKKAFNGIATQNFESPATIGKNKMMSLNLFGSKPRTGGALTGRTSEEGNWEPEAIAAVAKRVLER